MTAVIVAALSMTVVGIPLALALDRRVHGPLLLGMALLYGSGLLYFVLLALSIAGIRWTVLSVTVPALIAGAACWLIARRQAGGPAIGRPVRPHWLDLFTVATIAGYAVFATIAPLWEWDFWAIWGMKAKVFLERGGIDWRFLESRWNAYVHPDYPLLVPLNYDFASLLHGGWSDRWLGIITVAWAVALVLIVRHLAAMESGPVPAALAALVIAPIAASRFIGIAEGPLIAFSGAAVLLLRRGLLFDDDAGWRHGAVLLGLAANVKNEGVAMIVAVIVALLFVRPRAVVRLWPSVVIAAPWLVLRAVHHLQTDITSGAVLQRLIMRLPHAGTIGAMAARTVYHPFFWALLLVAFLIVPAARKREAFVLLFTAVQLSFYLATYLVTPNDPRWHIETSWSRLTEQIAVPITFVVILLLADAAAGRAAATRRESA